ncbi:MAG TPA: glycosyltransferase family 1 protein [Candidatus Magasanikbacteria bacterium]|jgi:glycosyltransferase involved in cell wall biosynthesis|nr:glycosyltransferase family 4 protein [Candidatus Magasanikbacteria bacterium]HQF57429.1 glycosyltransferase family 1 protein [Candidatus Magasanikbacteria bacterium]HQL53044.1 glycosyltransferase family 1 protein [Candidatus Magasanikbacteria bacterium]
MRIGIDCRMLGPGFGLARYVEQLVKHLLVIDSNNEYVLFVQTNNFLPFSRKCKVVVADIPWYSWAEQIKFKKIIDREKVDLMHFPHWNVPFFYHKPFVVTIHDLIMYRFPRPEATTLGPLKFWLKDQAHRLLVRQAVKKAKHILTTSEFTKQDIHQILGVPMEKMLVTYQAPFENQKSLESENQNFDLNNYNINKKYVLYVGAAYPHKNLERLLQAWKIFSNKHGNDYQLVLVGKDNYFYHRLINDSSLTLPLLKRGEVVYTGFVPDDELIELYKNASLYIFPSLYEGFGLPPLEAQIHKIPVVSSNASCLPEVLTDSVLYFDPENIEQMADIIWTGLTDNNLRLELQNNAQENLKRFSWQKLAEQTLDVYKKTLLS